MKKPPPVLDRVADVVLAYRPSLKKKTKSLKKVAGKKRAALGKRNKVGGLLNH